MPAPPAQSEGLPLRGSLHKAGTVQTFFASIANRYDLANHLLSVGCDFWWRRVAASIVASWKPTRVLDLACGSGDLALAILRACPTAKVIGADFCAPMLAKARAKSLKSLVVADALRLPFADESFEAATVAFGLRNMESWPAALRDLRRVLKPGGHLLILDFSVPPAPLRWIYRPYLHWVLPMVASALTGQKAVYQYLADSIEEFPSGRAMAEMLEECGFGQVDERPLQGGIVSIQLAVRS